MPTFAYIHFQGQCAPAFTQYAKIFDGTDLQMMRYADAPEAQPGWAGSPRIMHGQITLADGTLMGSDYPPGMDGVPQSGFSVMQSAPDPETGRRWFERLAEGGKVINAFGPTFFSSGFGMVQDRFGTHWIISAMKAPPPAAPGD